MQEMVNNKKYNDKDKYKKKTSMGCQVKKKILIRQQIYIDRGVVG